MKTIEINGVTFEVTRPRDLVRTHQRYLDLYTSDNTDINECYTRPSHIKELIYYNWHNWWHDSITKKCFEEHNWCGVRSYNTYSFTIGCCVCINGIDYIMEITPSHNRLIQTSC